MVDVDVCIFKEELALAVYKWLQVISTIILFKEFCVGGSKGNKVQLCMEHSHLCKQHHMECADIPETVNNSMQLCFSFPFFQDVLHKQTVYKGERTRSSG